MKLNGRKVQVDYTPLYVGGAIATEGGSLVQFFDGTSYYPDRASTPGSPIIISHELDIKDADEILTDFVINTKYYENDTLLTGSHDDYDILEDGSLRIHKNVPAGTAIVIKAKSEFLDSRTDKYYEREDYITLRTILKSEAPFQLELSQRGKITFDGWRNPNTTTQVDAILRKGEDVVTDFTGLTFKWLNSAGKDAVDYEAYAVNYLNDGRSVNVDKSYINNETMRCEVWENDVLLGTDSVTFVRHFNNFRAQVLIPELPISKGIETLNCSLKLFDILGEFDVDAVCLVTWMLKEDGNTRELGTGADISVPVSTINLTASNIEIYPDVKRRMAWAAIQDVDGYYLVDVDDAMLMMETYSD